MKLGKLLGLGYVLLLVFLVFRAWFTNGLLSGGDLQVYFQEMFVNFSFFPPPAWNWTLGGGLGGEGFSLIWNYLAVQGPLLFFGDLLGFNWEVIQRVGYFYPFLLTIFISSYLFFKKFFSFELTIVALVVFSLNTYILMILGGGQIFIAFAYAVIPLVFYSFQELFNRKFNTLADKGKTILIASLAFSFQTLLDIRIAYVTVLAISVYFLFLFIFRRANIRRILLFVPVFLITFLLHSFWLIPTVLVRENPLSQFGDAFTTTGAVKFLSFANFENTISLLHPNWPENIFGKVYFMKPEFLVIPLLAFAGLFVLKIIKSKKSEQKSNNESSLLNEMFIFFALLGLIGAFLAKGANEPFGYIYLWLFENVPGFIMFRDSTKWYPLIGFSYAFLIPFSIYSLGKAFNKVFLRKFLIIVFLIFWGFLIKEAVKGELKGYFVSRPIPQEYISIQGLNKEKGFFRTLWVPRTQRFTHYTIDHPAIMATSLFKTSSVSAILNKMETDETKTLLQESSVKYVAVPYDSEGEIFLDDRKYNSKLYEESVKGIGEIKWLKRREGFGKIKVFEVPDPRDHFWSDKLNLVANWKRESPSRYEITVKNAKRGDRIIFAENYNSKWVARYMDSDKKGELKPIPYKNRYNSFVLREGGSYRMEVYYSVQKWVNLGTIISGAALSIVAIGLIVLMLKKK